MGEVSWPASLPHGTAAMLWGGGSLREGKEAMSELEGLKAHADSIQHQKEKGRREGNS